MLIAQLIRQIGARQHEYKGLGTQLRWWVQISHKINSLSCPLATKSNPLKHKNEKNNKV